MASSLCAAIVGFSDMSEHIHEKGNPDCTLGDAVSKSGWADRPRTSQTPGAASLEKAEQPFSRFGQSQVEGCLGGFRGPSSSYFP